MRGPSRSLRRLCRDRLDDAAALRPRRGPAGVANGRRDGAAHPNYPHAYLFSIGVRRAAQGTGLGRKVIAPVLDACDRAGLPAYLENSNPANTGFYASCGFAPQGDPIHPEPDSPPLIPMVREPRRS